MTLSPKLPDIDSGVWCSDTSSSLFRLTLMTWWCATIAIYTWNGCHGNQWFMEEQIFCSVVEYIWKMTLINCRKPLDLPPITPFLLLPWQHIGFHGNIYLRFLLPFIMDLPDTFFPNQWNIWELRKFFHHHSNRYQGNQTLVFFLLLGSHGSSSCQLSSRSVQNWGKNDVTPIMFRTPEQYVFDIFHFI